MKSTSFKCTCIISQHSPGHVLACTSCSRICSLIQFHLFQIDSHLKFPNTNEINQNLKHTIPFYLTAEQSFSWLIQSTLSKCHVTSLLLFFSKLQTSLRPISITSTMSFKTAAKRGQFDLDRYVGNLRVKTYKEFAKHSRLPTIPAPIPTLRKDERLIGEAPIVAGDLAYIVSGKHKGKISRVLLYTRDNDTVLLNEVTKNVVIPKQYWAANQTSHVLEYPVPIPRKFVRLAAKEKDEKGNVSYVVAEDLVFKEKYYDDRLKRWVPRRFVKHHENIEIPWPSPMSEPKDDQYSTLTEDVYNKTHELQTVAKSPFPKSVLNELRNPYSKFKKRELTEGQARRLNAPQMPLSVEQKIYLAKKAQTPVKKLEPLSEEAKDLIGSRMAEHLAKIKNPLLLKHLEAVSQKTTPEFQRVLNEIEGKQD
ncbi:hypothetical protein PUMCH_003797 [Australozyma saopauloensis]|uniref:54S ribosomal protein L40, mitochondrial n=1 Tax=Australozyma saopauloensis TaxID=291208 RepID=A0AAX4HDJ8_9ASCO|nr:hypothetical protein PUMCH_003797 [[Candida] saopauloensis]